MELRQAILAEYFTVDSDGKMYVGGGFDKVSSPAYPAKLGEHHLAIVLDAVAGEPIEEGSVRLVAHGGQKGEIVADEGFTPPSPIPNAPRGEPVCLCLKLSLDRLVLPSRGDYRFDVYVQGRLAQSLRMSARLAGEKNA